MFAVSRVFTGCLVEVIGVSDDTDDTTGCVNTPQVHAENTHVETPSEVPPSVNNVSGEPRAVADG